MPVQLFSFSVYYALFLLFSSFQVCKLIFQHAQFLYNFFILVCTQVCFACLFALATFSFLFCFLWNFYKYLVPWLFIIFLQIFCLFTILLCFFQKKFTYIYWIWKYIQIHAICLLLFLFLLLIINMQIFRFWFSHRDLSAL